MQDLYPARYQTMTEVPDKLDTSKYSNISKCKIVNIPSTIDLNDFKKCRNDGVFMNLQVAHDTSTFTTVF